MTSGVGTGGIQPGRRFAAPSPRLLAFLVIVLLISVAPYLLAGVVAIAPLGLPLAAVSRTGIAAFEHPTRARILSHLETVPGDSFRSIARSVEVSVGEARHHINVLMRRGRVREQKTSGRCRYYLNGTAAVDRNEAFEAFWTLRECRQRVLRFVQDRGEVTPSCVAAALGISRQLASYHLRQLAASGQVRRGRGAYLA